METFSYKTEDFHITHIKIWGYQKVIYKIKDIVWKTLKYNDGHRKTLRIQLKNEVETFSDKTEDFRWKSNIWIIK